DGRGAGQEEHAREKRLTPYPLTSWHQVHNTIAEAVRAIDPTRVKAIGITNQRETTIVWDREVPARRLSVVVLPTSHPPQTGKPLHNAIVWNDSRTVETVDALVARHGGADCVRSLCGLPLSTYFSAVKCRWLLDHCPAVATAMA